MAVGELKSDRCINGSGEKEIEYITKPSNPKIPRIMGYYTLVLYKKGRHES
jgi:hypothetical protein